MKARFAIRHPPMTLWLLLAFIIGSISGFGLFALLQMSRDTAQ